MNINIKNMCKTLVYVDKLFNICTSIMFSGN